MVTNIQEIIKIGYSEALKKEQVPCQENNFTFKADSTEVMLQAEQNFHLFFTIVNFIEQDLLTNIAMPLDINCQIVMHTNFTAANRINIHNALQKVRDIFQ